MKDKKCSSDCVQEVIHNLNKTDSRVEQVGKKEHCKASSKKHR